MNEVNNQPPCYTRRVVCAFVAECGLIVALLFLADSLPGQVLTLGAVLALAIPVLTFASMLFDPAVCSAWRKLSRELGAMTLAAARILIRSLTSDHFSCVRRTFKSMKWCPGTADDWLAFVLFPFKVYVLMAIPFAWFFRALHSWFVPDGVRFGIGAMNPILLGFVSSLLILGVGSLVQAAFSRAGRSTQTARVLVLGFVLLWAVETGMLPFP